MTLGPLRVMFPNFIFLHYVTTMAVELEDHLKCQSSEGGFHCICPATWLVGFQGFPALTAIMPQHHCGLHVLHLALRGF